MVFIINNTSGVPASPSIPTPSSTPLKNTSQVPIDQRVAMQRKRIRNEPFSSSRFVKNEYLGTAIKLGLQHLVASYIALGIDVDEQNEDGETLLMLAIKWGQIEIAGMLIKAGADTSIQDKDGNIALRYAVALDQTYIATQLLDGNLDIPDWHGNTALFGAISLKNVDLANRLIDAGANISVKNEEGLTPLHRAVIKNEPELVQRLIKAGADVNAQSNEGVAPIHIAYTLRLHSVFQTLVDNGAQWELDTGHEVGAMVLPAAAWGIGGMTSLNKKTVMREKPSYRNPAHFAMSEALQTYIEKQVDHGILNAPEIITTLQMHDDFDIDSRLSKIQKKEPVMIQCGYEAHSIVLLFYQGYLCICNRGEWGSTKLFKIDPAKMTRELLTEINTIMFADEKIAKKFFYEKLTQALSASEDSICKAFNDEKLGQKAQRHDFCAYVSPESAIFNMIALQRVLDPKRKDDVATAIQGAKKIYKNCTTFFRLHFLQKYLEQIKSGRIKKEWVDRDLLEKIQDRLKEGSTWHPERFESEFFKKMKDEVVVQLAEVL